MAKAENQGIPGFENVGIVLKACQKEILAAAKRIADGQLLEKLRRTLNETVQIRLLLNPEQTVQDPILRKKPTLRKTKKGRKAQKSGDIRERVGKYNLLDKLSRASSGLTFGQLDRGDAIDATQRIRKILKVSG